jgi:phage terminase large subunit
MSNIKSMADIDLCIIEEAEDVAESSWVDLEPTIRAPKSELWVIWNPKKDGSPVDNRLVKNKPPRSMIVTLDHNDNPWFTPELEEQRAHARLTMDPGKYAHVWEGQYLALNEATVFKNWKIQEFEAPAGTSFRLGADWGFSVDPSVLVRCYIEGKSLYVDYEAYMVGCEIVGLPTLFASVPDAHKWIITADSARPETISHLRKHGYPKIVPALKGAKSLEEGVEFLQSFEIVVHPRCVNVIREMTNYSFKVHKDTQEVLSILEDKDNHTIDAIRYACEAARRATKPKPQQRSAPPRSDWG